MVPGNQALVPIFEGENMALSSKAKKRMEVALARRDVAQEVCAAIDSSGSGPAANVPEIGVTVNLPAAALSTSDTYTDAAVNGAINALKSAAESRLDVLEGRVDAIIAALQAAGLMS
jgi:hypothetical protein